MNKSGRKLRHSQALLLATQRPEVGGDGEGVHFHSLTVMVTAPEKWRKKGRRESMLLSSSFTLSLLGCEHTAMISWEEAQDSHKMALLGTWALVPHYVWVELDSVRTLAGGAGAQEQSQTLRELLGMDAYHPDEESSWCHKGCSDPESLPRDPQGRPGLSPWAWLSNMKEGHCPYPCLSLWTWYLRPNRHLSHSSVASDLCQLNHGTCVCVVLFWHTVMENSAVWTGRKIRTHGTISVCVQLSHPLWVSISTAEKET